MISMGEGGLRPSTGVQTYDFAKFSKKKPLQICKFNDGSYVRVSAIVIALIILFTINRIFPILC